MSGYVVHWFNPMMISVKVLSGVLTNILGYNLTSRMLVYIAGDIKNLIFNNNPGIISLVVLQKLTVINLRLYIRLLLLSLIRSFLANSLYNTSCPIHICLWFIDYFHNFFLLLLLSLSKLATLLL